MKGMGRGILLVHGGAGDIPVERVQPKMDGVRKAVREGYRVLIDPEKSVIDAVEMAVRVMEDDEAFNAGRGSVLNLDGEVEMDAIIMEGKSLKIGSVAAVKNISHPISLARLVMESTQHVMLAGPGANRFAEKKGVPTVGSEWLVTDFARESLERCRRSGELGTIVTELSSSVGEVGTVGAVAIDSNGHVAVATSTGGTCGKLAGRVGDTPIPGSGGYADDMAGAVSTTGHGESIMRHCVAHGIIQKMRLGDSAQSATQEVLDAMAKQTGQTAGAITISKDGELGIFFNSRRMAWAYMQGDTIHSGIDHGDDFVEKITHAVWWYYFSKLLEFCDTFFFIPREKENQLTFLHVYHHSTMFSLGWIGIKWVPRGSTFLLAMVNSFIHVLMYTYYGLSTFGPNVSKYLWWKMYLTILQLVQYTTALILGVNGIKNGCDFPLWMQYALVIYMVSLIVLFGNFLSKAYVEKAKQVLYGSPSKSSKVSSRAVHMNGHKKEN